jgi:predicted alpha/beta hydrolase family esterase
MRPSVLVIPGLYNSGPQHWQSIWQARHPDYQRLQQKDWATPRCIDWITALDQALSRAGGPFVLAAHSTGCATVVHWAANFPHHDRVHAAFLVGPSDPEAASYPSGPTGFAPMPLRRLPFRSVVVASEDDPYVISQRAQDFAVAWGSEFCNIGRGGHINTDSGHGPWVEGEEWLEKLRG